MADTSSGRRYPAPDQRSRILSSGETAAPNTWNIPFVPDWYQQYTKNFLAGFPQNILQVGELPEMAKSAAVATYKSVADNENWGKAFGTSQLGGAEQVAKVNKYTDDEVTKILADMPAKDRTPQNAKAARDAVMGSQGYHDMVNSGRWNLSQSSVKKQDQLQEALGLQPIWQQSTVDEVEQMIPGLLIPTPSKLIGLGKIGSKGVRALGHIAESFLPGVTGPVNAGINAAVQGTMLQGGRYLSDSPSLITGEGLTTDTGVTYEGLPGISEQSGPATSSNTPPPSPNQGTIDAPAANDPFMPRRFPVTEDASAPSPFALVTSAAATEAPAWKAPFEYGLPKQQPVQLPQDAPQYPDKDPEGGGGGSAWAIGLGAVAALGLAGAALRGKVPAGLATRVIQDVDSPAAATRMQPVATPNINLEPSLGAPRPGMTRTQGVVRGAQKVSTWFDKSGAIKRVVKNALDPADPATQDKLNKINREVGTASPLEVANAAQRTYATGELPLMTRNTIALDNIRKWRDANLDDAEKELFQKRMVLADRLDLYTRTTNDLSSKLGALRSKLANTTAPQARRNLIAQIQPLETEHRTRTSPTAPFEGGLSVRDVNALIAQADANPKIRNIVRGLQQVTQDVEESSVLLGRKTRAEVTLRRQDRPNFVPTAADPHAKATGISGAFERMKSSLKGRKEIGEEGWGARPMYAGKRSHLRSNKLAAATPHDELHDVLTSMESYIHNFHRQVRADRAAQTATELVLGTNDWGKSIQRAHPPVTAHQFEHPGADLGKILREKNIYTYNADGMVHIMRAADHEFARGMLHNPSSTVGIMDNLRRWMQMTYTRDVMAPWFAYKAGENELAVARIMLDRNKYSVGWMDRLMKDVFPPMGHLSKLFEMYPDPTFRIQHLAALAELTYGKSINKLANMVGSRMMQQSQMLHMLGPITNNRAVQAMIRTTNDIRTRITFMENQNILTLDHIVHANERIWDNWKAAKQMLDITPKPVRATVRTAFDMFLGASDVIRNAPKYAIASQNLDRLLQQHHGNIPNDALREYVKDMRYMGGDMSKAIGSPAIANLASIAPYGANSINSYMHLGEGFAHNKTYVGSRILTHMVLPKVLWTTALSGWMGAEFLDWYYGDMPTWQRQTTIPMLSPSYLLEVATGEFRKPTINDITLMHQAPEATLIAETVMNGLQALGWFDVHKTGMPGVQPSNNPVWKDEMHALAQIGNFALPVADLMAVFSKDPKDNFSQGMSSPSESATMFKDLMSAVFAGSFDVAAAGYSAATDSLYRGKGIADALESAFSHAAETAKQKYPETPLSPLFGGQRRHYTKGATRERNLDKFDAIQDVTKQMKYQKNEGENPAGMEMPLTHDPDALRMMSELHSTANAHVMLTLRKQRAELYDQINYLDANKGKQAAGDYTKQTEDLKVKINAIDRHEEEVFQRLEMRLANHWGPVGVTDVDSAIKYIQSTVTP